jgi:hypothetical protein
MLASFPASMVNQKPTDLGIPNRFKLKSSRFRAAKTTAAIAAQNGVAETRRRSIYRIGRGFIMITRSSLDKAPETVSVSGVVCAVVFVHCHRAVRSVLLARGIPETMRTKNACNVISDNDRSVVANLKFHAVMRIRCDILGREHSNSETGVRVTPALTLRTAQERFKIFRRHIDYGTTFACAGRIDSALPAADAIRGACWNSDCGHVNFLSDIIGCLLEDGSTAGCVRPTRPRWIAAFGLLDQFIDKEFSKRGFVFAVKQIH